MSLKSLALSDAQLERDPFAKVLAKMTGTNTDRRIVLGPQVATPSASNQIIIGNVSGVVDPTAADQILIGAITAAPAVADIIAIGGGTKVGALAAEVMVGDACVASGIAGQLSFGAAMNAPVADVARASTHYIPMSYNGVEYRVLVSDVAY